MTVTIDLIGGLPSDAQLRSDGGLVADADFASAEGGPVTLGGQYRLAAAGAEFELELVDTATKARSLLYAKPDVPVYLFVPPGRYGYFLRLLAPAGSYKASLSFERLGLVEKARFWAAKLARLALRPGAWLSVAGGFAARRQKGVTGASLVQSTHPVTASAASRLVVEPVAHVGAAVSIILPTKTRHDLLRACVESLDLSRVEKEIIIVDNGADSPQMLELLAELALRPDTRVLRDDEGFNYSRICNTGARAATKPVLLFLNDDIEALDGDWLDAMLGFQARDDVGVVGARLLYPSGDLQHAGIAVNLIPGPGHPWRGAKREVWASHPLMTTAGDVDAVTGACLMIGRELFLGLGVFDEDAFAVTLNDVDLCLKARRLGLKVVYAPHATLLHKEGQTRQQDDHPAEAARRGRELATFFERYGHEARHSVFYPLALRRDTDTGAPR